MDALASHSIIAGLDRPLNTCLCLVFLGGCAVPVGFARDLDLLEKLNVFISFYFRIIHVYFRSITSHSVTLCLLGRTINYLIKINLYHLPWRNSFCHYLLSCRSKPICWCLFSAKQKELFKDLYGFPERTKNTIMVV